MNNFRGILILQRKEKKPPKQTLDDLRSAGYILLFLDDVDGYRVEDHISFPLVGNARLLMQKFFDANELDNKRDIARHFGQAAIQQLVKAAQGEESSKPQ
jgi:hypothetical protein